MLHTAGVGSVEAPCSTARCGRLPRRGKVAAFARSQRPSRSVARDAGGSIWNGPGEMQPTRCPMRPARRRRPPARRSPAGSAGRTCAPSSTATGGSSPGAVLGHEICGEVLEVGPDADGDLRAAAGDLVHVISTLYCGHCSLCRSGTSTCARHGGLMGFDYQGAYAELVASRGGAEERLPDPAMAWTTCMPRSPTPCPTPSAATRISNRPRAAGGRDRGGPGRDRTRRPGTGPGRRGRSTCSRRSPPGSTSPGRCSRRPRSSYVDTQRPGRASPRPARSPRTAPTG